MTSVTMGGWDEWQMGWMDRTLLHTLVFKTSSHRFVDMFVFVCVDQRQESSAAPHPPYSGSFLLNVGLTHLHKSSLPVCFPVLRLQAGHGLLALLGDG